MNICLRPTWVLDFINENSHLCAHFGGRGRQYDLLEPVSHILKTPKIKRVYLEAEISLTRMI